MRYLLFFILCSPLGFTCFAQQQASGFEIVERKENKQIDILFNGRLLTAYCYYDSIKKPFLFPINTIDGITVTRGYPIHPLPGERTDHPHHTGSWMNYESVNGLDFWNNSTAIPTEKSNLYGTIKHATVVSKKTEKSSAALTTTSNWLQPDGHVLINEKTTFIFRVQNSNFFIDRISTLTANDQKVVFKDAKDGFFAIRVARELEMPSGEAGVFIDVHGNKTTVAKTSNEGVTGMYYSSAGLKGDSVWGTKGTWTMLTGKKEGKNITVAIMDHPANIGYPTYWHARGYGLFAANPLGRKIFSNGKEELNFSLEPHTSVTFRYRVLIASAKVITASEMNQLAADFSKTK